MSKNKKLPGALQYLPLVSQLGITFAANIFVAVLIGHYLDRWIGTSPLFILLFCFLGFFSGLKSMYTLIIKVDKRKKS